MNDTHRNVGSSLREALAPAAPENRSSPGSNATNAADSRKMAPPPNGARMRVVGELDSDGRHFLIVEAAPATAAAEAPPREARASAGSMPRLLTPRELQVAALVASGQLNKQIAARLRISEFTVCAHIRHIFWKLSIKRRSALASMYAASVGARARKE